MTTQTLMVGDRYYLIVTDADATIMEFKDEHALLEELRDLYSKELDNPSHTKAFIFEGRRAHLTKGQNKYLVLPDNQRLPIASEPKDLEIDDDGYVVEPVKVSISAASSYDDVWGEPDTPEPDA